MYRTMIAALAVAVTLAAIPSPARSDDWDEDDRPDARYGNGEVSVDLEGAGVTPELFTSTLSPYGEWYTSARYGSVWRPRVEVGWRPYYNGSWLWTDEGWYWDSAEPFSWAVYHYGRWAFDPSWGWVWVPGYQWAPAWVAWRSGGDAIGWAPLGPGVSVFVTSYPFVDFWWTFVPCNAFAGVPVQTVAFRPRETSNWFRATTPAPPRASSAPSRMAAGAPAPAWGGPTRTFIEQRTGRPLTAIRSAPAFRPGQIPAGRPVGPGVERREGWSGRPGAAPAWQAPAERGGRAGAPAWQPPAERGGRMERGRPEAQPMPRSEPPRREFQPAAPPSEPRPSGGRSGGEGSERGRGWR